VAQRRAEQAVGGLGGEIADRFPRLGMNAET
jgi:hypothetical protein